MKWLNPMLLAVSAMFASSLTFAGGDGVRHPDCAGADRWPTSMALVLLRNAGLLPSDNREAIHTHTTRIASEPLEEDVFRQVHRVVVTVADDEKLNAIVVNDASVEECSMGPVELFLIDRHLDR